MAFGAHSQVRTGLEPAAFSLEGPSVPGVAHVAGEAVDEVVLAAVGLVGDDDDVAPVRKHGVAVALLGRHELLDGREDDATAGDAELLAQVGPVGGLDGILALESIR